MKTPIQVSLLIAAMAVTASGSAQRAEPAVKPESEASVDEQRPLASEQTQPPVLIIELPPPRPPEEEDLDPRHLIPHPAKIGIHRSIPEQWWGNLAPYLADGALEVISRGAQAVRVALTVSLPDGGRIVFSGVKGDVVHTLTASELREAGELIWSPVIEGEAIRIELEHTGPRTELVIEKVAHIDYSVSASESDPDQPDLGCPSDHIDVQCRAGYFPDNVESAVVQLTFEKRDATYACSATLINTVAETFEPYLLTAQHCIGTHSVAASVYARWFYQVQRCDGTELDPRFTTTYGGADLIAASESDDMALLRLRRDPPKGVLFAGWNVEPIDPSSRVHLLSHPQGGIMKYMKGSTGSEHTISVKGKPSDVNARFIYIRDGAVEPGSSGGGIFNDKHLMGVISASSILGSCNKSYLYAGTLEQFYPHIERHLDPAAVPRSLAYFLSSDADIESFVQITSHANRDGTVVIEAWDDGGELYGPVDLALDASTTTYLNSDDLERGNWEKGLRFGIGHGTGNWRLAFDSDLVIDVTGYLRTDDGFLTAMNSVVTKQKVEAGWHTYYVPLFNPASDQQQRSLLRVTNPRPLPVSVKIEATDDDGTPAPKGQIEFELVGGHSLTLDAVDLEQGHSELMGQLGNGSGRWKLWVSADQPINVISLMLSPTGHLSNLSR